MEADQRFDALLTIECGLHFQQHLSELGVRIVVIHAHTNRMAHLRPLSGSTLKALGGLPPGKVREVGAWAATALRSTLANDWEPCRPVPVCATALETCDARELSEQKIAELRKHKVEIVGISSADGHWTTPDRPYVASIHGPARSN